MTVSRDLIQGFIDGYLAMGGDPTQINVAVSQYLTNHPVYPQAPVQVSVVASDLASYRVTPQAQLAPTPLTLSPSAVSLAVGP